MITWCTITLKRNRRALLSSRTCRRMVFLEVGRCMSINLIHTVTRTRYISVYCICYFVLTRTMSFRQLSIHHHNYIPCTVQSSSFALLPFCIQTSTLSFLFFIFFLSSNNIISVCALCVCMFVCCHAVLCCAVLCCAVLCCAVLCCAVLCCAVLCCAVLCCAVLCCAVYVALYCTQL